MEGSPSSSSPDLHGLYFTDGEGLFWVAGVHGVAVLLEDCVSGAMTWWPVKDLIASRFRRVLPMTD